MQSSHHQRETVFYHDLLPFIQLKSGNLRKYPGKKLANPVEFSPSETISFYDLLLSILLTLSLEITPLITSHVKSLGGNKTVGGWLGLARRVSGAAVKTDLLEE